MDKKLKIFIILSVAANLIFIGLFLGYGAKHHKRDVMRRTDKIITFIDQSSIPEGQQNTLIARIDKGMQTSRNRRKKSALHDEAHKALVAEDFDKEEYRAKLQRTMNDRHAHKLQMSDILVDVADALNQTERKHLAHIIGKKK